MLLLSPGSSFMAEKSHSPGEKQGAGDVSPASISRTDFQKVGLISCAALVAANMIGTGVFTSLGFQVAALPSAFLIMLLWALGGVIAFCGALCYAELAAALPRSGGEYNFLGRCFHPAIGFMAGFVSVAIGFSAPIALASIASGRYMAAAFPGLNPILASVTVVLALTVLHSLTVKASGTLQVIVTCLKVGMIILFISVGFLAGNKAGAIFTPTSQDVPLFFSHSFAVALMFVLYSYTGWNAAAYIISEVRSPQRTLPAALLISTSFVALLYVGMNMVFLRAAPMETYVGKIAVAEIAARNIFGDVGGRVMAGIIGAGLISTLSAMTWAGPRVAQTVGKDFRALRWLSHTTAGGVPRRSLFLQTGLVLIFLLSSTYEVVLIYAQFALATCAFLTVAGVIVLRIREPHLPRPFRCWGYPVTPIVFLLLTGFTMLYSLIEKPWEAGAGALTLLLGLGLYFIASRPGLKTNP